MAPGAGGGRFSAGVGELDAGRCAVLFEEAGDAGEGFDLGILPEAGIIRGDAAVGSDGGGFGEDESEAAEGAGAEVHEVEIVGVTVDGGVHAHRRDGEAIAECNGADGEGG